MTLTLFQGHRCVRKINCTLCVFYRCRFLSVHILLNSDTVYCLNVVGLPNTPEMKGGGGGGGGGEDDTKSVLCAAGVCLREISNSFFPQVWHLNVSVRVLLLLFLFTLL